MFGNFKTEVEDQGLDIYLLERINRQKPVVAEGSLESRLKKIGALRTVERFIRYREVPLQMSGYTRELNKFCCSC